MRNLFKNKRVNENENSIESITTFPRVYFTENDNGSDDDPILFI